MTEFIPPGTRFFDLPPAFPMKRGGALHGARVAFETWGALAPTRDNALLILTGLSPDAHAAANAGNPEPGWWEPMIGPGKPIDTNRWFAICVNSLGSCKGSTGPASINPATGDLYRLDFPDLSIEDIADAAAHVVRELGIDQLACVIGNSMGGMNALAFLARHPGIARTHVNISGAAHALPFSIAIRSLQREAIRLDPQWNAGQYDDAHYPESGMRMARKLGVITYRSALEWDGRFGRVRLDSEHVGEEPFGLEFEVESYLE
ncbi:MAG: alpha/beta fold hydrolase, partial [Lysobacter sp.]